jgi:2Fe-2S ferredoxin
VQVVFIKHDGTQFVVTSNGPTSLMRAAVDASVPGILAMCGGSCTCGTCQVYVDPQWVQRLPAPGEIEAALLESLSAPRPNSRLSCQIELGERLDGLTVELPESQY